MNRMKLLLSRLTIVGALLAANTLALADTVIFQSQNGYTIVPPQEMHQVNADLDNPDSDVEFREGQDAEDTGTRLGIAVQPDPSPLTLKEAVRVMRTNVEHGMKDEHYKVSGQGTIVLDGSKALTFTASLMADDGDPKTPPIPYRNMVIVTLHDGKLYILNYASPTSRFAQTKQSLDASLASLRWTK